jgi:hypothetical protein
MRQFCTSLLRRSTTAERLVWRTLRRLEAMTDDQRDDDYGHHPEQHAGATTAQTQAGGDVRNEPPPVDLRDTYGNAGPAIGDAEATGLLDVPDQPGGPYPPPSVVERPHASLPPETISAEPTRDPSLSRAVDRAAAGLQPEAAGYDRSIEGPPPGPLDPAAEEQPAEAEDQPGGQWGSS